jgi:hypothetical protein
MTDEGEDSEDFFLLMAALVVAALVGGWYLFV